MKHESAVQAVKELMRKDSVFRSVIQGWGVATLLIGLFMFYMGANTYIGNAPNFMVKSISDENGVKMPSFFGYIVWSLCCLVPVFLIDTLLFFI